MREIKFRFRYTDGGNWIFRTYTMPEVLNGEPFEVLSDAPLLRQYKMDGWDQFTGLRDKSGREIYDGDVVAVSRCDSFSSFNRAIIVYADNYGAFLLQYVKKARKNGILAQHSIASIDGETIFGYCTGWEIEVIGNIYQDSHLLDN